MKLLWNVSARRARTFVLNAAWILLVPGMGIVSPESARADAPRVQFDMPYSVAARDVTSPEFKTLNPHEKLVELKFEISSLLVSGEERDLRQYLFRIVSPQHSLQVVDYLPKTAHESPLAGNVTIEKSEEKSASLGINVSGHYEIGVDPNVNGGAGQKNSSSVKYELLPPRESVTASGTILRGTGVYFKMKASDRNLLEGSREVALVVRVPRDWRADYLHVRCEADGYARSFTRSLDSIVATGERDFLVVAYLEGDEEARTKAEALVRREAVLRRAVARQATEGERRGPAAFAALLAFPSVGEKGPALEERLQRMLFGASVEVSTQWPQEVRHAAAGFAAAKSELARLNGWEPRPSTTAALAGEERGRR